MRKFVKNLVSFAFSLPTAACHLAETLANSVIALIDKGVAAVCDLGCTGCALAEGAVQKFVDEVFDAVDRLRGLLK